MAKFCQNCGSPISEGALFCFSCGAKLPEDQAPVTPTVEPAPEVTSEPVAASEPYVQEPAPIAEPTAVSEPIAGPSEQQIPFTKDINKTAPAPEVAPAPIKKEKKHKKGFWVKLIVFLLIIAAIAAGVVYCVFEHITASKAITKAVDSYVEAVYLGNGDALESLVPKKYSDELYKEIEDSGLDTDPDEIFQSRSSAMDDEFGNNIVISYKITDLDIVPCFNEYYYTDIVESNHKVKDIEFDTVYRVRFDVTVKGDNGDATYSNKMAAVEIDGDWYLIDLHSGYFSYVDAFVEWLDLDMLNHDEFYN